VSLGSSVSGFGSGLDKAFHAAWESSGNELKGDMESAIQAAKISVLTRNCSPSSLASRDSRAAISGNFVLRNAVLVES
jgi:hypothetical protein